MKTTATGGEEKKNNHNNIVIPYVAEVCEKQALYPYFFKTHQHTDTHLKDHTHKHKQFAVQYSEECTELYIEETKQPLHKHVA